MSNDDFDTPGEPVGRDDDPEYLLASAYVDGEASDDERTLVETSPTLLDDTRRFGDVRTVLAGTAPEASLSQREDHLAAALDVWERMSDVERRGDATPVAVAGATTTNRRATRRRRRERSGDGFGASQWFLSAAAVLVVIAGGAAIVRGILADTDDTDSVALDAVESDAPAGVENIDALEEAEVAGENVGDDGILPEAQIDGQVQASGDADDSGLFDESTAEADAADGEFADTAVAESAESAEEDLPADAIQPSPAPEEELPELETRDELADFGSLVIPALEQSPIITSDIDLEPPPDSCEAALGVEQIAGVVFYQGQMVTVGVDLDQELVLAYVDDAELAGECEVVDRAVLREPAATDDGT